MARIKEIRETNKKDNNRTNTYNDVNQTIDNFWRFLKDLLVGKSTQTNETELNQDILPDKTEFELKYVSSSDATTQEHTEIDPIDTFKDNIKQKVNVKAENTSTKKERKGSGNGGSNGLGINNEAKQNEER